MKNVVKAILAVGTLATASTAAYKIGEQIGKAKGLLAVVDKYSKQIDADELTIDIFGIVEFAKKNKKE